MFSVNPCGFLKLWLVYSTLIFCDIQEERVQAHHVHRCSSYPVEATCGDEATYTVMLSAEICTDGFAHTKCEECVSLTKLTKILNKFYSCKIQGIQLSKKVSRLSNAESKRLTKRQIPSAIPAMKSCDSLEAPKPGKLSCRILPNGMNCTGMCNEGYRFSDGTLHKELICREADGTWRPQRKFEPCEPQCNPQCLNGGLCLKANRCFCTKEFRGPLCEYPISNCEIFKTESSSSWKCNHTKQETLCSVACYPPGSFEAEQYFRYHRCNFVGEWTPKLPPCVESYKPVLTCKDPGNIENGWRKMSSTQFVAGSIISYYCFPAYELRGESELICLQNHQWNAQKPKCIQEMIWEHQESGYSPTFAQDKSDLHTDATLDTTHQTHSCSYSGVPANTEGKMHFPCECDMSKTIVLKHNDSDDSKRNSSFPVGTRIQYKCRSQYYKLYGSEYQTCQESGSWSGHKPACIPECGISDTPRTPFIVNGNKTLVGQWPWQVAIVSWDEVQKPHLVCGGVLISEKWVLTAAHCIAHPASNVPLREESLSAIAGKYYRSFNRDDEYVQKTKVRKIIVHQDYDFIRFDSDIALVELDPPVEFTSRVQPICLPTDSTTRENIREGQEGVVIGWGLTEEGNYSEELRETVLPVVSHSRCEESYRDGLKSITVTDNMFCAGYDDGTKDTCNGDSGGPMMFLDEAQKPHRWTLEGIVSWGSHDGCGQIMRFAGFTKVRKFVDWTKLFI